MRRMDGRHVERLVGHLTFAALAARPCLSTLHTVYAFIRQRHDRPGPLWEETRSELVILRWLLLVMASDWWLPHNRLVYQTDASEEGWAVAQSFWEKSVLDRITLVSERSRFKRSSHSAREAALAAAGMELRQGKWAPHTV